MLFVFRFPFSALLVQNAKPTLCFPFSVSHKKGRKQRKQTLRTRKIRETRRSQNQNRSMGRPFCSSCLVFHSPFSFFVVMHEGMRKTKNGDGKSMRMEIGKQGNQGKQRKQNTVKQVPILYHWGAPLFLIAPPESIRVRVLVGQPVRSVFFVSCFPRVRVKRWCAPVRAACAQFRTHSALASCMRRETDNRHLTLLYRSWHSPWSNPDWSLDCRRRQKCKLWLA